MSKNNCTIGKQYVLLQVKDKKHEKKLKAWLDSPLRIRNIKNYDIYDSQERYSWERGE